MASKKKVATASSKRTPRSATKAAKPKAPKPEAQTDAPALAEQQTVEVPTAVEPASVVEVEAVAPATATATLEPPAKKPAQRAPRKNHDAEEVDGLIDVIFDIASVKQVLVGIGFDFSEDEKRGFRKLGKFARLQSDKLLAGKKPGGVNIRYAVEMAKVIHTMLEDRFDSIMQDTFRICDKGLDSVRKNTPQLLAEKSDTIFNLQSEFRRVLATEGRTHNQILVPRKALLDFVSQISEESAQAMEIEREVRRREKTIERGGKLSAAIDELGLDD